MTESTSQTVLAAVRSLLPSIAAAAADVDRNGFVDSRVLTDLHDAGYFSLLQPRLFGGVEAEPDEYLTATRELSSACMSTGWLAGWLGVNNWGLSVRDQRVLQEIWGSDARALLCSSYAPTGRLERADGGFWLSGRWSRCTGAHHAAWLSAAALRVGPDGAAQDFMAVLVPRTDYVVEPIWNGLGLRGIGADDVVVSRAFVPEHRAFSWLDLRLDSSVPALDRLPQPTLYTLAGTMPLIGAAQRLLAAQLPEATTALAMARTDVDLSVLQIRRNVGDLMECVRAEAYPDAELMLRTRRDQVMACERAVQAIEVVLQSQAYDPDENLRERVWRDVQTARMHVASNVEQVLSVAGRFAFGLDVDHLIW
ncbi:acyl-CoA dehydrogenase family protein [Mycobacterium sp. 21AC1]|uniref:acyl-CoA dehydrogenase family protein n=1 Tax=[Mycobacterium] appelbergii TaxID=2939269 RepID=UPI00293948FE|nr:acyl-CoA dehydrogenase family protein [Mycobacterium sp. 21AC1]MDV3125894.1 acyl-CoA dehydrogenase family protein [Mycobacterium sp. 21AC1]